ncbi:MAG: hypothetical protein ACJ760_03295 [Thermoleophilaceae bacterium]
MLLIRFMAYVALVVAAIIVVAISNAWWVLVLGVLALLAGLGLLIATLLRYASAADWAGPGEEVELESAGLVEADTGLPKRGRFDASKARDEAREIAEGHLVAVPGGWRGPEAAHRLLLVTTAPLSPAQLQAALPSPVAPDQLAVLVVVPTLAASQARYRAGDPDEAVSHAEEVARETVESLAVDGTHVSAHIGAADPAVALSDGLRTYDAERVIVARHHGDRARYLEDVPLQGAADIFGVPMTEIDVGQQQPAR